MSQFISGVQDRLKTTSLDVLTFVLKVLSGSFLGLTLALISQEIIGFGTFSFVLVIVSMTLAFLKVAQKWSLVSVLVFNLVCILIGMLLRMYILIAPGQ